MGIVFRQSIKSTLITFTGAVLGAAISYAYSFILSQQELGFIRNIIAQGTMVHLFVLMGISNLLAAYIPKFHEDDEKRKILITIAFITPLVFTLIYAIPYELFKQQVTHLYQAQDLKYISSFYKWLPVLVLLIAYVTLLDHYLLSQSKIAVTAFSREILLRVINILSIVLFYFKIISFRMLVISNVLAYTIPLLLMFFTAKRTRGFGFSTNWRIFKKVEYKEMLVFSWYHLLLGVSLNIIGYLDLIMLGLMAKEGVSTLAVYSWALFIISVMGIPYRAMSNATYTIINKALIDRDNEKVADLFHRSGINMLIMAVGLFAIIACNTDNLVAVLPKGYESIKSIVLILMIGRMVDMSTGMNSELISFSKYFRFNFRISLLLVLTLFAFLWFLIPRYGIYGAAWGATISLTIFNVSKMIFLYWKMKLQPFSGKSVFVLLAGLIIMLVGIYLPFVANPYIDTIIRSAIIIICYLVLLLIFKPSADLTSYINHLKLNKKLY